MSCPNLIVGMDTDVCSMTGRSLSDSTVSSRCNSDMYIECPHLSSSDIEIEMDVDEFSY